MASMDAFGFGRAAGTASAGNKGGWWGNSESYGYCISVETTRRQTERVLMHEIGHTFGLWHIALYDPKEFIMGSGKKLALHEARWLSKHHYFNDNWQFSFAPKITKFHGAENFGEDNIRFRIDISDLDGSHQSYLMINSNIIGWDFLEGKQNDTTDILDIKRKFLTDGEKVWVQLMDKNGNWFWYPEKYVLPKPIKNNIADKDDPINLNDENNCINCEIENEPDNEQRAISPKYKLSISWAKIKSKRN